MNSSNRSETMSNPVMITTAAVSASIAAAVLVFKARSKNRVAEIVIPVLEEKEDDSLVIKKVYEPISTPCEEKSFNFEPEPDFSPEKPILSEKFAKSIVQVPSVEETEPVERNEGKDEHFQERIKQCESEIDNLKHQLEHGQMIRMNLQQALNAANTKNEQLVQAQVVSEKKMIESTIDESEERIEELEDELESLKENHKQQLSSMTEELENAQHLFGMELQKQQKIFEENEAKLRESLSKEYLETIGELNQQVAKLNSKISSLEMEKKVDEIDTQYRAAAVVGAVSLFMSW